MGALSVNVAADLPQGAATFFTETPLASPSLSLLLGFVVAVSEAWCVPPMLDDRTYVHARYFAELVEGSFRDDTRLGIAAVVDRMKAHDQIEAVVLGGTELPLLFREHGPLSVPTLDTTTIHVEAAIARMRA